MEYKKLNELCEINIGKTPSRSNEGYWGRGINWISISDLKEKYIYYTKEEITKKAIEECNMKKVFRDTVVMSFKLSIGKVAILKSDMYTNEAIANFPIKNKESMISEYLYYALKTINFTNTDRAVMGATLNKSKLNELVIPYCNIEDQNKVVNILNKSKELIDKRKEQIENLEELVKSQFIEMFGNEEYDRFELISLVKEGAGLSYGIVVPGENVEDGIEMIRPLNFDNGKVKLVSLYKVDRGIEEKYAKTRLLGDELLIQVIGNPGEVVLTTQECEGMNVTRNLAVIRQNNERVNKYYLREYLRSWEAKCFMMSGTNQSTLKQLPLSTLKKLSVQLPPIELQNQFADFVKQTDKLKFEMEIRMRN